MAQIDTEFWFVAPRTSFKHNPEPTQFVFSAGDQPATIFAYKPADPGFVPITYQLNPFETQIHRWNIYDLVPGSYDSLITKNGQITDYGVHFSSTAPVQIYYQSSSDGTNPDVYSLKGRNALGRAFTIPSQHLWRNATEEVWGGLVANDLPKSAIDVVASEDQTLVSFYPSAPLISSQGDTLPVDTVIQVVLDQGQTYRAQAAHHDPIFHLGGTKVISSKPIAISISDDSVDPYHGSCGDLVADQLVPEGVVGTEYIIMQGWASVHGPRDYVFVQPIEDSTNIVYTDGAGITKDLMIASYLDKTLLTVDQGQMHIKADKPVYILHVSGNGCELGGAVLPAIDQCTGSSSTSFVRSPTAGGYDSINEKFGINIFAKTISLENFAVNGGNFNLDISDFDAVPGTGGEWSSTKLDLSDTLLVPIEQVVNIKNSSHGFHLGMFNGESSMGGTRYGYFSSFSNFNLGEPLTLCQEASVELDAGSAPISYQWASGETTSTITVDQPGVYTVEVLMPSGCSAIDSVKITQAEPLVVDLIDLVSLCSIPQLVHFDIDFPLIQWSSGDQNATLNATNAGRYMVTVTNEFNCTAVDSVEVQELSAPTVDLIDSTLCFGETLSLSAPNADQYLWSDGTTEQEKLLSVSGNYGLTVTTKGCSSSDNMEFIIAEELNPFVDDQVLCPGRSVELTPGNFESYVWSAGVTEAEAVFNATGTYGVTVHDQLGCAASAAFQVLLLDSLENMLNDTVVCPENLVPLTLPGEFEYNWNDGSTVDRLVAEEPGRYAVTLTDVHGCSSVHSGEVAWYTTEELLHPDTSVCKGKSLNVAFNEPGTYLWDDAVIGANRTIDEPGTYHVQKTDSNQCKVATQFSVIELDSLRPVTTSILLCNGDSALLYPGSFHNYEWSTGASSSNLMVLNSGQYSVTIAHPQDCKAVFTYDVEDGYPLASLLADTVVCPGQDLMIALDPSNTYLWGDGASSASVSLADSGLFSVTATDLFGCITQHQGTLAYYELTNIELADTTLCDGDELQVSLTQSGVYQWSDGVVGSERVFSSAGDFAVTITNENGCASSAQFNISQMASKTVEFNPLNDCVISGAMLSPSSTYDQYLWSTGSTTAQIAVMETGVYALTATQGVCSLVGHANIKVFEQPQVSVSTSTPAVCLGGDRDLTLRIEDVNDQTYQIQWSPDGETVYDSAIVAGATNFTLKPWHNSFQILSLSLGNGCSLPLEDLNQELPEFITYSSPTLALSATGSACLDGTSGAHVSIELTDGAIPWSLSYVHEGLPQHVDNITTSTIEIHEAAAGAYEVYAAVDQNGCEVKQENLPETLIVGVQNFFEPEIEVQQTPRCEGVDVELNIVNGGDDVIWTVGEERFEGADYRKVFDYDQGVNIQFEVANGVCLDTGSIAITIDPLDYFLALSEQNVFTPDGDGVNDELLLLEDQNFHQCFDFVIYDRWGKIVYESNGEEGSWNGVGINVPVTHGTYFAIIRINGHEFTRTITVL